MKKPKPAMKAFPTSSLPHHPVVELSQKVARLEKDLGAVLKKCLTINEELVELMKLKVTPEGLEDLRAILAGTPGEAGEPSLANRIAALEARLATLEAGKDSTP